MIDINILPKKAQNKLIDFYNYLVERYAKEGLKKQEVSDLYTNHISKFFNGYDIDLRGFKLNRSEIYERYAKSTNY